MTMGSGEDLVLHLIPGSSPCPWLMIVKGIEICQE